MSVSVDTAVIQPGDDRYVEEAWDLKETIRRNDGVLKQRRNFFVPAYRRARTHVIRSTETDELVGFASTRSNGYLLFLAIAPSFQDMGFGRDLVAAVADEHETVTCHARVSNERALHFYDRLGFEIERRIPGYYEDGGDAYYLRLGEERTITSRVVGLFR